MSTAVAATTIAGGGAAQTVTDEPKLKFAVLFRVWGVYSGHSTRHTKIASSIWQHRHQCLTNAFPARITASGSSRCSSQPPFTRRVGSGKLQNARTCGHHQLGAW